MKPIKRRRDNEGADPSLADRSIEELDREFSGFGPGGQQHCGGCRGGIRRTAVCPSSELDLVVICREPAK